MLTLAEAQVATQDKLYTGVIDEFRKDRILDMMIFDDAAAPTGGSSLDYTYDRITTQPTAATRAINAVYTDQETKLSKVSTSLKILGGSFTLDRVISKYMNGIVNQTTMQVQQKIKAVKALFSNLFINGDKTSDATQFDGLDKLLTATTTVDAKGLDLTDVDKTNENKMSFACLFVFKLYFFVNCFRFFLRLEKFSIK